MDIFKAMDKREPTLLSQVPINRADFPAENAIDWDT
jgi:hypothetical protein